MNTDKRNIRFLERREVEKIIAGIKPEGVRNLRDRALLDTLFSSGLRIAEALALPRKEFIEPSVRTREITIIGKGGYQRVVYVSPKALASIFLYLKIRKDADERLFPITPRCAQKMIKERARSVGLGDRHITPHTLRHSFATDLLNKGIDIRIVQDFLGHKSITSTMVYTHTTSKQLKDIHAKLYK